ncbi:MAG TPA: hypothetical protein VGN64_21945, partial [Dyadobacter sp.]|nr:hypothetical protein [Dyadobacter sp.]
MKFLRILLKIIGGFFLVLLVVIATMITTMDHTPYKQMPYYKEWKGLVGKVEKDTAAATGFKVGWAKVNITPSSPVPMAGYGNRRGRAYETVHDSVYVRAIVIDNGHT